MQTAMCRFPEGCARSERADRGDIAVTVGATNDVGQCVIRKNHNQGVSGLSGNSWNSPEVHVDSADVERRDVLAAF